MSGSRFLLVVALVSLALVACGRRRGSDRGAVGARQVRELQRQAATELGCAERALTVTPLNDRVMQVHGCGQLRDYALGSGRRGRWSPIQPVYVRAAAEMACPSQQLTVQAPAAAVRNAEGCGRTARYDLICGAAECAWTMTAHAGAWAGASGAASADAATETRPIEPTTAGEIAEPAGADIAAPAPIATPTVVTTSGDEAAIPAPPAAGSPEELLRAILDAQRAQIHRCAGAGVIPVRASWGADGNVSIALDPPLAGTPVERCLRIVVGAQRVSATAPGELVHPVQ